MLLLASDEDFDPALQVIYCGWEWIELCKNVNKSCNHAKNVLQKNSLILCLILCPQCCFQNTITLKKKINARIVFYVPVHG